MSPQFELGSQLSVLLYEETAEYVVEYVLDGVFESHPVKHSVHY